MAGRSAATLKSARRRYAQELRYVANVRSRAVLRAFATVPRERFLGPGPWQILGYNFEDYWTTPDADPRHLYHNILVAIDPKRRLNNGQPAFWAFLFDALDIKPGERVAHIGAGMGYYSAILAETVGRKGRVAAYEIDRGLARRARRNLSPWPQVRVTGADGSRRRLGPVDVIVVNAGVTHPAAVWLDALAPGGRMILPLTTDNNWGGRMLKVTRQGEAYAAQFISGVAIFPCAGARDKKASRLLEQAFKSRPQGRVKSLRRERHKRNATCWLHGKDFCLSRAEPAGSA